MAQEKFYTVKMLAQHFSKHENTIYRWIVNDKLFPHALRVKDGWFIPSSDLKTLVKAGRIDTKHRAVEERPFSTQSPQDARSHADPAETPPRRAFVV